MKAHWSLLVDKLRTGFWFVPLLMLALSAGLALLLLYVDRWADPGIRASLSWAYTGGPSGARSLLSTIAGSMITAASVTFSLAAVALSLASQQYGSRVLRNFMRDGVTQVLLGTFVATFVYCVLVVRSIRGTDYSGGFVPAISVTVAIVLAVLSLVLLIYFIHHVSASIQASQIIRVVAREIAGSMNKLYPSDSGEPMEEAADLSALARQGRMSVALVKGGYVQTIDLDRLVQIAARHDVALELTTKPGEHLIAGAEVVQVWGAGGLPEAALDDIRDAFDLAQERTPAQDIRYSFQQLTDVIVRALSPGINDPFTAINGIDELAAGVALMASHDRVSEQRKDKNHVLRLVAPSTDLGEVLEETVGHIALYAAKDHFVMDALRRVLEIASRAEIAGRAPNPDEETTILRLGKELDRLQRKAEAA